MLDEVDLQWMREMCNCFLIRNPAEIIVSMSEFRTLKPSGALDVEEAAKLVPLEDMLVRLTQNDVVYRRHLDPNHRAFVPDFEVFIRIPSEDRTEYRAISRQLVLFCVERRKAWRLLQSQAGIDATAVENKLAFHNGQFRVFPSANELFLLGRALLLRR